MFGDAFGEDLETRANSECLAKTGPDVVGLIIGMLPGAIQRFKA